MAKKWIDGTVPRFLLVGVINTLVGCGAMFLLYNLAHWSYWLSSAANYLLGGIVSFFLNKYFTFRKREWSWGQAVRFAVNVAACWLLAYGLAKPAMGALLSGTALSPLQSPWCCSCWRGGVCGFRRTRPCWWACACTRH